MISGCNFEFGMERMSSYDSDELEIEGFTTRLIWTMHEIDSDVMHYEVELIYHGFCLLMSMMLVLVSID